MRKLTGSFAIALASVGTAAAMALTSATPAVAANQALMLNGIGLSIGGGLLPDVVMSNVLGGMFGSYQRTAVSWPMQANPVTGTDTLTLTESVADGVTNLDAAIKAALAKTSASEHVTVVGLSAGALVADEELRKLITDPNAPAKNKLTFVVVADSSRANFNKNRLDTTLNYQYKVPVQSKYDTIVVTAEYDGFADFPDRVWNIVAVANAFAGEFLKHVPSVFTDLSTVDPSNITVSTNSLGGVTTNYFIASPQLPLVELLPFLAPQEAQLKAIVDAGYIRNDGKSAATTPAAATTSAAAATAVSSADSTAAVAPVSVAAQPAPEASATAAPVSNKSAEPEVDKTVVGESPTTVGRTAAAATGDAPRQTAPRASARAAAANGSGHRSSPTPARAAAASRTPK